MPKTFKHLYPQIYDFENLYRAYRKARKGKRKKEEVAAFELNLEANLVKFLDGDPRVRLIRLPCGPTDRYVPKEFLYGEPIAEFVEHILAFAARDGVRYDLLHGHYADGWKTVTSLQACWLHHPPTLLTTHSLGRRKRRDALERGEGTPEELDDRYNFPVTFPKATKMRWQA
jgi:hypothetical protein